MFFQVLINAISVGSVYALIALGYNFVYGILEQLNFAHGDVYAVGCFVTYTVYLAAGNVFVAMIAGIASAVLINLIVERFAYRPLRIKGANRIAPTISAVGIAYIMRNGIQLIWGPQTYRFDLNMGGDRSFQVGGLYIGILQIWILAIAIAVMVCVSILLKKTKWGQAIIGVSQSLPTSELMGIDVNRNIALVYALGGAVGAIGGILFCSYYGFIYMGIGFAYGTMKAWMATVLGGIGSTKGAIIGAMSLGILETFVSAFISTANKDIIVWGVFILFILVRPKGLFPAEIAEKV
ncbi:branched-chain amino acid ABC transporter permease [Clostridium sp. KNHs216]|uniref:branched-chain amino acid ABC transporter permease n=1 Tax=Clostridium sp. KNHs216 TaxID=1550235 RepID=UPI001152503C|nr:branched-chain amino acid ABC transporter permease [Clostridium sp. KNHs216]TQI66996.1 branched-chain amino acid transport system permease protein [Clostridium sp. KNHs216]